MYNNYYDFPVVLTIAVELLKRETLLYTEKQQVHVAAADLKLPQSY